MIRHDMDDISDEVFEKACRTVFAEPPVDDLYFEKFEAADEVFDDIVNPCNEYIINYIKENFLNEFIAFDIATCYNMNAMWDEPFETQINSAIEDLSQLRVSDCDKSKVISILESKYKLRVKNESPIDIEDIKD